MCLVLTVADREAIVALLERERVPGLALALLCEGQVSETAVFGCAAAGGEPLGPDTLFEAASLTKPLFAYAVLRLAQDGRFDLDRPLLSYLPPGERPWPDVRPMLFDTLEDDPALWRVTAREALSHSAGFTNWTGTAGVLRTFFEPGTRFSYAGDGYQLLQDAVEAELGEPAAQTVRRLVLEPLVMSRSALQDSELAGRTVALPHDEEGQLVARDEWPRFYAAAGLHTTAADYGRFLAAMLNPGDGAGQLGVAETEQMLVPHCPVNDDPSWREGWPHPAPVPWPGVSWGLGWGMQELRGQRAFWHWGDNGGYKAYALGYPEERAGIVLLSNGRNGGRLWRPVLARLCPGPQPALDWLDSLAS